MSINNKEINTVEKTNGKDKETFQYSYDELRDHVLERLSDFKGTGTSYKAFCTKNEISYHTFIMFKNNKLETTVAHNFIKQILEALKYKVKTDTTIVYYLNKKIS